MIAGRLVRIREEIFKLDQEINASASKGTEDQGGSGDSAPNQTTEKDEAENKEADEEKKEEKQAEGDPS